MKSGDSPIQISASRRIIRGVACQGRIAAEKHFPRQIKLNLGIICMCGSCPTSLAAIFVVKHWSDRADHLSSTEPHVPQALAGGLLSQSAFPLHGVIHAIKSGDPSTKLIAQGNNPIITPSSQSGDPNSASSTARISFTSLDSNLI